MSTFFNETETVERHQKPSCVSISVSPSTSEPKAKPKPKPNMTNTIAMRRIQKRRHDIVK